MHQRPAGLKAYNNYSLAFYRKSVLTFGPSHNQKQGELLLFFLTLDFSINIIYLSQIHSEHFECLLCINHCSWCSEMNKRQSPCTWEKMIHTNMK